jgi:hypothetical protein
MSMLHNNLSTIERGALGVVTSVGSVVLSSLSSLEIYLRIFGLAVGALVGVATLVSVCLDVRKKWKNRKSANL